MTLRESTLSIKGSIAEFAQQWQKAGNAVTKVITDDIAPS